MPVTNGAMADGSGAGLKSIPALFNTSTDVGLPATLRLMLKLSESGEVVVGVQLKLADGDCRFDWVLKAGDTPVTAKETEVASSGFWLVPETVLVMEEIPLLAAVGATDRLNERL